MSVFTNPASGAPEQAAAYIRGLLDLVEDREPFSVLRTTAKGLRDAVEGMSDADTATPEAEGKWSVRQVLRHLSDTEIVWSFRLRLTMAEDRPPLTGYDQDAWADRLGYADEDPAESIDAFALLRRGNLEILERASEEDLDRVGVHAERGDESVRHMIRLYAGHDILHLRQVRRVRNAVSGRG